MQAHIAASPLPDPRNAACDLPTFARMCCGVLDVPAGGGAAGLLQGLHALFALYLVGRPTGLAGLAGRLAGWALGQRATKAWALQCACPDRRSSRPVRPGAVSPHARVPRPHPLTPARSSSPTPPSSTAAPLPAQQPAEPAAAAAARRSAPCSHADHCAAYISAVKAAGPPICCSQLSESQSCTLTKAPPAAHSLAEAAGLGSAAAQAAGLGRLVGRRRHRRQLGLAAAPPLRDGCGPAVADRVRIRARLLVGRCALLLVAAAVVQITTHLAAALAGVAGGACGRGQARG